MTGAIRACGPNTGSDCCSAPMQNNLHAPVVHGRMCAQCIWCRFVCMLPMMAEHVQTDFPSLLYLPADRVCPPTFSPILPTLTFSLHLNSYQYYYLGCVFGCWHTPTQMQNRLDRTSSTTSWQTGAIIYYFKCARRVCVCTMCACVRVENPWRVAQRAWSKGME